VCCFLYQRHCGNGRARGGGWTVSLEIDITEVPRGMEKEVMGEVDIRRDPEVMEDLKESRPGGAILDMGMADFRGRERINHFLMFTQF
jgi:hypothetical protein